MHLTPSCIFPVIFYLCSSKKLSFKRSVGSLSSESNAIKRQDSLIQELWRYHMLPIPKPRVAECSVISTSHLLFGVFSGVCYKFFSTSDFLDPVKINRVL